MVTRTPTKNKSSRVSYPSGPRDYKPYAELSSASKRDRLTQLNRIKRYWGEGEVSDYVPPECWPAIVKTDEDKCVKARASDEGVEDIIPLGDAKEWPSNLLRRLVDVAQLTVDDPAEAGEYMSRTVRTRRQAFMASDAETDYGITGQDCGKIRILLGDIRDRENAEKARACGVVDPRQMDSAVAKQRREGSTSSRMGSEMGDENGKIKIKTEVPALSKRRFKRAASPPNRPRKRRSDKGSKSVSSDEPSAIQTAAAESTFQEFVPSMTGGLGFAETTTSAYGSSTPIPTPTPVRLPSISMMLSEQQDFGMPEQRARPIVRQTFDDFGMEPVAFGKTYAMIQLDKQIEDIEARQAILATKERLLKLQRAQTMKQYHQT